MTKFIIGVVVGIFLGASVGAYGAVAAPPATLSSWTVANDVKRCALIPHQRQLPIESIAIDMLSSDWSSGR
ncbi:hypothetical protein JQ600_02475 [Bradyrhizobium sp. AUGA SZCCT0176]|uniref:hypothetical protein n=1 Tax=Bradyrhizobium sp. AUGA SZCCT0176 TaxID=2807664 RepID=UPI001BA70B8D|nr:hypothetical protein [Bradyrhizobium sp. AUGA SZCCT0176]MBR1223763.1 hypothetical protein [Bradyrhizobium sp. AUGA SZCCT0176]